MDAFRMFFTGDVDSIRLSVCRLSDDGRDKWTGMVPVVALESNIDHLAWKVTATPSPGLENRFASTIEQCGCFVLSVHSQPS
jgi:hypothetical protein